MSSIEKQPLLETAYNSPSFIKNFTPPSRLKTFALRILEIGKTLTDISQIIFTPSVIAFDGSLCRRLVLSLLYPISVLYARKLFGISEPTESRKQELIQDLINQGFTIEEGVTKKEGRSFHYLYISHPDNNASKIALEATGNMSSAWLTIDTFHRPQTYKEKGYNLLIVDGPNIGGTLCDVNAYTMGLSQEAALCLAENIVGNDPRVSDPNGTLFFDNNDNLIKREIVRGQILAVGHSLGGAMLGQALKNHKHKEGVDYHYVFNNTFSSATAMGGVTVFGSVGASLVDAAGLSLDTASVIQNTQLPKNVKCSIVNSIDDKVVPIQQSLEQELQPFNFDTHRKRQTNAAIWTPEIDPNQTVKFTNKQVFFYVTRAHHGNMLVERAYGSNPELYQQKLITRNTQTCAPETKERYISADGRILEGDKNTKGLWKMSDNFDNTLEVVLNGVV